MATLTRDATGIRFSELVKTAGLDALAGVWLFFSAFLFSAGYSFFVNNLSAGGLVAIFAFFAPFAHRGFAWIPLGIALWVAVSPFVLGFTDHTGATWNNLLTGVVVAGLTIRSAWLSKEAHDAGVLPE